MAHVLIMPRQGNTVESCIITGWKVKEGEAVSADTIVCEVETDKAAFELPAGADGIMLKILHNAGDDVPVLEPIAVIGMSNEDVSYIDAMRTAAITASSSVAEPCIGTGEFMGISPRARGLADKEGVVVDALQGSGPGGRIIERDVKAAIEGRPLLTVAAREMSAGASHRCQPPVPAIGEGSGIGGRVTVDDLHRCQSPEEYVDAPVKGIRKIISDRMFRSLAESAQFTLNASAPAQRLLDIKNRLKEKGGRAPGVNDFILFAVPRVLPQFNYMNAHWLGDTIRTFNRVHLGFAVDTPRGLMVPVIKNANLLSLAQISAEAKRLAAACHDGRVKPEELTGSTFTVSNLGGLGVTSFTPILNTPEVGILGVGAIQQSTYMSLSLTINHQAVDGAPAARFLKAVCDAIADIDLLLVEG